MKFVGCYQDGLIRLLLASAVGFVSMTWYIVEFRADAGVTQPYKNLCVGYSTGCVLLTNNRLKCWGSKNYLAISTSFDDFIGDSEDEVNDNLPSINLGESEILEKVYCGGSHFCVKLRGDVIKCAGGNFDGQVGIGVADNYVGELSGHVGDNLPIVNLGTGIKVIDLVLGAEHTCVKVTGNKLKCFGKGEYGYLGYGNTNNLGESASHMGDALPFVNLGSSYQVQSVHAGIFRSHTCVILSAPAASSQRLKCWGKNDFSQLGYGDTNHRGDQANEMGDSLPLVDLGTESKVKKVAMTYYGTCVLLVNNNLKCWGAGNEGVLGSGSTTSITSTGNSIPVVAIDSGKTVMHISGANVHFCISYTDEVTVKCVGINTFGQLGQGDTSNRGNSPTTTFPNIPAIDLGTGSLKIRSIHTSANSNCVAFVDNSVKCFGSGYNGMLMLGSKTNFGGNPGDMGTNLPFARIFSVSESPTMAPTSYGDVLPRGRWVRANIGRSQISVEYTVGFSVEEGQENSQSFAESMAQTTGQSSSHEFSSEVYGEVTAGASFFGFEVSATVGIAVTTTTGIEHMVEYSQETSSEVSKSVFKGVTSEYSETVSVGCGDELGYNLFIYEVESPTRFKVIPKPIIAWCKVGSMAPVCPPNKCADLECTYCRTGTFKDANFDAAMSDERIGKKIQELDPDAPKSPTSSSNMELAVGLGVGIPCALIILSLVVVLQRKQIAKRLSKSISKETYEKLKKDILSEAQKGITVTQLSSSNEINTQKKEINP